MSALGRAWQVTAQLRVKTSRRLGVPATAAGADKVGGPSAELTAAWSTASPNRTMVACKEMPPNAVILVVMCLEDNTAFTCDGRRRRGARRWSSMALRGEQHLAPVRSAADESGGRVAHELVADRPERYPIQCVQTARAGDCQLGVEVVDLAEQTLHRMSEDDVRLCVKAAVRQTVDCCGCVFSRAGCVMRASISGDGADVACATCGGVTVEVRSSATPSTVMLQRCGSRNSIATSSARSEPSDPSTPATT